MEKIELFIKNIGINNFYIYLTLIILLIIEIFIRFKKRNLKKKFKQEKKDIDELVEVEKISIKYYREYQLLDIFRFFSILIAIILIMVVLNINALNILAVVAGATIIILREFIFSFVSFFYLISIYKTGDDIKIDDKLGEIFRINPFYVALSGKDEDGEYDGKLHRIPNFTFVGKNVELQNLKTNNYRKVILKSIYNHLEFKDTFSIWIEKIREFLNNKLPERDLNKVGYYKSYTGLKYKLNFDYGDKGEIICKISFIAKYPQSIEIKEEIIEFIENQRKEKLEEK